MEAMTSRLPEIVPLKVSLAQAFSKARALITKTGQNWAQIIFMSFVVASIKPLRYVREVICSECRFLLPCCIVVTCLR